MVSGPVVGTGAALFRRRDMDPVDPARKSWRCATSAVGSGADVACLPVVLAKGPRRRRRRLSPRCGPRARTVWADLEDVDLEDIAPSAVWMDNIKTAIANADSLIFFISPDSVTSQVCGIELNYAVDLSKRIVPVVIRDTPVEAVPAPLPDINWAFVRQGTFDADVARLVEILETDIERIHLHTRLLVRATEWETRGGDKSLLLRGAQLAEAEQWLAGQTDQKPTTTPAQGQFIAASRRAASRRQRGSVTGAAAVILVMAVVTTVAVFQWHNATVQRNQAQANFRQATSVRLVSDAQGMLAGTQLGGDARAFAQLLASRPLTQTPDNGALYSAVVKRVTTDKIIPTPDRNTAAFFSPEGHRLATASTDHTVRLWNADSGQPIGAPLKGHTAPVPGVTFSPDGHRLATAGADATSGCGMPTPANRSAAP